MTGRSWRDSCAILRALLDLKLTLSVDSMSTVKRWVDASYRVHHDMRSHTGGSLSLGRETIFTKSTRQQINYKSSTETELVAATEVLPQILWTTNFLEDQGVEVRENCLFQDNKSAMQMENNGGVSSGQRTRHINIRYFFIKDRVETGEVTIIYCPPDDMIADFFTKPLQGMKFVAFRKLIMGNICKDGKDNGDISENKMEIK